MIKKIIIRKFPLSCAAANADVRTRKAHISRFEPHYEIYDCPPLRIQLYPSRIRFIKLCQGPSLSPIEEICEGIILR